MSTIIDYIRNLDTIIVLLVCGGLFLVAPSLKALGLKLVDLVKGYTEKDKKPVEPPYVPPVVDHIDWPVPPPAPTPVKKPGILELVKEWDDLYKICQKADLPEACEKIEEAWHLLQKSELDKQEEEKQDANK